jgi:hypothetical protein
MNLKAWWPFGKKDKVAFNQLPEQIREHEHYRGVHIFGYVWWNEERAIVQSYPNGDRGDMETDNWVKTTRDGWVKI